MSPVRRPWASLMAPMIGGLITSPPRCWIRMLTAWGRVAEVTEQVLFKQDPQKTLRHQDKDRFL